jgi:hypothetical protein
MSTESTSIQDQLIELIDLRPQSSASAHVDHRHAHATHTPPADTPRMIKETRQPELRVGPRRFIRARPARLGTGRVGRCTCLRYSVGRLLRLGARARNDTQVDDVLPAAPATAQPDAAASAVDGSGHSPIVSARRATTRPLALVRKLALGAGVGQRSRARMTPHRRRRYGSPAADGGVRDAVPVREAAESVPNDRLQDSPQPFGSERPFADTDLRPRVERDVIRGAGHPTSCAAGTRPDPVLREICSRTHHAWAATSGSFGRAGLPRLARGDVPGGGWSPCGSRCRPGRAGQDSGTRATPKSCSRPRISSSSRTSCACRISAST